MGLTGPGPTPAAAQGSRDLHVRDRPITVRAVTGRPGWTRARAGVQSNSPVFRRNRWSTVGSQARWRQTFRSAVPVSRPAQPGFADFLIEGVDGGEDGRRSSMALDGEGIKGRRSSLITFGLRKILRRLSPPSPSMPSPPSTPSIKESASDARQRNVAAGSTVVARRAGR